METRRCKHGLATLLLTGAFMATGCGGDAGVDTVYLYFINGYPATGSVDVIGKSGILFSGAQFGDRNGETGVNGQDGGVCPKDGSCVPAEFDRSVADANTLTYIVEGIPTNVEVTTEFFSMYPQETGTILMTRRSGSEEIDTTLLRHTQTISSDCTLTMVNGLSLSNEFLADGLNNYNIAPEFKLEPIEQADFFDETEQRFRSQCGPLPLDDDRHRNLARSNLRERVQNNPWFFPVDCSDSQLNNVFCYGWGIPEIDDRSRLYAGGQVKSVLNSEEYFTCVENAITIKQPEDEMNPLPFPPEGAQIQCPEGDITWDDVDVDAQAVEGCREQQIKTATTIAPTAGTFHSFQSPTFCEVEFRVRNEGQDLVFGPEGNDDFGKHQDGALVSSKIESSDGDQHFWVLLGRPVNPIIWQWDSGDAFVNFNDPNSGVPYPNDGDELIGEYDHE